MNQLRNIGLLIAGTAALSGCQFEKSGATGWNYNDSKNGGFEKAAFEDQENGPGRMMCIIHNMHEGVFGDDRRSRLLGLRSDRLSRWPGQLNSRGNSQS